MIIGASIFKTSHVDFFEGPLGIMAWILPWDYLVPKLEYFQRNIRILNVTFFKG